MRILIILHLLIIICVCVFFMQLRFTFEKFGNINVDIGNRICEYFFNLGSSIMKKHDFNGVPDYTGITFFDNLPKIIPYNPEEFDKIHDAFIAKNINDDFFKSDCGGCSAWEITNNQIYNFWKIMHPLVQSIMNEAFLKSDLKKKVDCPIIHFRCADTPFVKQNGYHFQYYTFFEEALKEITKKSNVNYSKVILMSCNTHNSDVEKQNACVDYTDSLKKYLNEIGMTVGTNALFQFMFERLTENAVEASGQTEGEESVIEIKVAQKIMYHLKEFFFLTNKKLRTKKIRYNLGQTTRKKHT